jgi:hypothetical protein
MENCLISKEPMVHKITLPCQHSFDYYYLYHEVIEQKNRHIEYFKCPYCRAMYYSTLPYYEIEDVKKIVQVNYNNKQLLPLFPCSWRECTLFGNVYKSGHFCKKHYPLSIKKRCTTICLNGQPCKNHAIPDSEQCKRHIPQGMVPDTKDTPDINVINNINTVLS